MAKKKKQTKTVKAEPQKTGMDRAAFLKIAGGGLACILAMGAPAAYWKHRHIDWEFLGVDSERKFGNIVVDLDFIKRNKRFVQIGDEQKIDNNFEIQEILMVTNPDLAKERYPLLQKTDRFTQTLFGLVGESEPTANFLKYSRTAVNFVLEKLESIPDEFKLVALKPGDNYATGCDKKMFVGEKYFQLVRMVKDVGNNKFLQFSRVLEAPGSKAIKRHNGKETRRYCFLGMGPTSILSPISEFIHLSVSQSTVKISHNFGVDEAVALEEALVETLSQKYGRELARIKRAPSGEARLNALYQQMTAVDKNNSYGFYFPEYRHLPDAMSLEAKLGDKAFFDLYMQDPLAFRNAIYKEKELRIGLRK